jgi:hypothetical protein
MQVLRYSMLELFILVCFRVRDSLARYVIVIMVHEWCMCGRTRVKVPKKRERTPVLGA